MPDPLRPSAAARHYQRSLSMILLGLFISSITLGGGAIAHTLNQGVHNRYVFREAAVLIGMIDSIQDYTNTQIQPVLSPQLEEDFWLASVPSYVAKQVFETLRQQPQYSRYSYKEAVLNPTNLSDKADNFEQALIQQLRHGQISLNDPINGQRMTQQGEKFYSAKAITVSDTSCLQCHSTADVAPVFMVDHYGTENGFGWQLNEIVGVQMVYLPLDEFARSHRQLLFKVMAIFATILMVSILFLKLWLRTL